MNAIFGLKVDLSLSDRMLVALVTGTALYLTALPSPDVPHVLDKTCQVQEPGHLAKLQSKLKEKVEANKEYYGIQKQSQPKDGAEIDLEEKGSDLELAAGNKVTLVKKHRTKHIVYECNQDTCVLEVDDIEDADIVNSLLDAHPPSGFQVSF